MPTWVKVILIIVLVGFAVLVAGIVIAARWVKSQGPAIEQAGKDATAEAKAFGQGKDGEACIAESFRRQKAATGFLDQAKVNIFLQQCLDVATVAPETCKGVPEHTAIMDSVRWKSEECARRGRANDQACLQLISALQVHCAMERSKSRSSPSSQTSP
ncbi:MAG TPA: hypothetical protein VEO54_04650 [Thermoanaerobaculia bacterium]|nr:hypothetical protein [Thermoanaerobaculia bacterium]